jgi:hypothetical protein
MPPSDESGEGTYLEHCSRTIQSVATYVGHAKSEISVTIRRNRRSRSVGIRTVANAGSCSTQATAVFLKSRVSAMVFIFFPNFLFDVKGLGAGNIRLLPRLSSTV